MFSIRYTAFFILFILKALTAQQTVAVLDFEGRGINVLEAATLTDRFTSELGKTGAVRLVDRNMVDEILTEQGFQQSGCTSDECAVEVGALLGVQFMISGSIGKLGETFTIDMKMTSVESGATDETRNVTHIGKVDGLVTEIEILAWDIMNLTPPEALLEKKRLGAQAFLAANAKQKTRIGSLFRSTLFPGFGQFYSDRRLMGLVFLGLEVGAGALAYTSYNEYLKNQDNYIYFQSQYAASTNPDEIASLKAQAQEALDNESLANDQMTMMLYAVGALHLTNMVHAFIRGPKTNVTSKEQTFDVVYDPILKQPKLRFSIALD